MTVSFVGRRWPDETQLLLLKAALLDGAPGTAALREWESRVDIERLGSASYSLLPLLFFRADKSGLELRDAAAMRGLYRRTWYQNQMALSRARSAISLLGQAGISVLVLKGTALISLGLVDAGARPMADADVLVPPAKMQEAFDVLRSSGYRPALKLADDLARVASIVHSTELVDGAGNPLDLHWHVMLTACAPDSDDAFWAGSRPVSVLGAPAAAPSPADLLLHVVAHGSLSTGVPSFRWIADAVTVVKSGPEVDWDRFLAQARHYRVASEALRALQYVETHFAVALPPAVMRDLEDLRSRSSLLPRVHYALQGASTPVLGALGRDLARYLLLSEGRPIGRRLRDGVFFFRTVWNVSSPWDLPGWLLSKVRARVRAWRLRRRGALREHDRGA